MYRVRAVAIRCFVTPITYVFHAVSNGASYLPEDVGVRPEPMLGNWSEHVDELLDEGERVRHRVDLEGATVVVTNRRVLAFRPDEDGPNYRSVERPNVTRASVETDSAPGRLVWATLCLFPGLGLLLLGTTTDLAALADGYAGTTGDPTGVADAALEGLAVVLTVFDLSIIAAGAVLVVVAVAFFAGYVRSRTRRLVLRVSGREDVSLPVTDADLEAERTVALEEAIGPETNDEATEAAVTGAKFEESA